MPLLWKVRYCGAFMLFLCSCGRSHWSDRDHTAWADSVAERCSSLISSGHSSEALAFLDSAYRVLPDAGPADRWRKYNVEVNYYKGYGNDSAKCTAYLDSMFGVIRGKEEQYRYEYCQSLFAKAAFLQYRQQYTRAIQYYYDGRSFAEAGRDTGSMVDFNNSIGLMFYCQQRYGKAIPFFRQALAGDTACSQCGTFYYRFRLPQSIFNNIALSFEREGQADSAILYYLLALQFIREKGRSYPERDHFIQSATGVVEGNLGGVYALLGRQKEAEAYLLDNIRINDRPGYPIDDAQTSRIKLANFYVQTHRLPEAAAQIRLLSADLASGRGKGKNSNDIRARFYELVWKYADARGSTAEAYQALQRYDTFKDSMSRVGSGMKNADVDQVLHEKEQRYQFALLKKNNEIKTVWLAAAVIFLVMTIGIALLTWRNLRRTLVHVKKLTAVNKQFTRAMAALKKSQEDNIRMVKIAAHDLRGPIGAMVTGLSTMMMDSGRSHAPDSNLLRMLKTSGENALALTNDLLQVNPEIEEFEKEPVDLDSLLRYCIGLLQHKADEKSQTIRLEGKPVVLQLSMEKMWRVFSNLIANAIKFSPTHTTITISLDQDADRVLLSIRDQGIGIPPELRDKVFDMFTKAKRRGTGGEQSFGLGLAISRQIVEAHGGRIWFESESGEGTTFFMSFPPAA